MDSMLGYQNKVSQNVIGRAKSTVDFHKEKTSQKFSKPSDSRADQ